MLGGSQHGGGGWVTSSRKQAGINGGESAENPAKEVTWGHYPLPPPLPSPLYSHCCECPLLAPESASSLTPQSSVLLQHPMH
jgi:hypothetical protein